LQNGSAGCSGVTVLVKEACKKWENIPWKKDNHDSLKINFIVPDLKYSMSMAFGKSKSHTLFN
jgi:hypothetical protein